MKDEDFDNLGKRLYDLEADPPEDGWKKLSPVVAPPVQTGFIVGLRRHWWKPFVVALPIFFYSVYEVNTGTDQNLADSIIETETLEGSHQNSDHTASTIAKTEENVDLEKRKAEMATALGQITGTEDTNTQKIKTLSYDKAESRNDQDNHSKKNGQRTQTSTINSGMVVNADPFKNEQDLIPHAEGTGLSAPSQAGSDDATGFPTDLLNSESKSLDRGGKGIVEATDTAATGIAEEAIAVPAEEKEEEATIDQPTEDEKKETSGSWRISATFNPSYLMQTATPITDDEVYITDVENSKPLKKSGYGFSFGVGKAIASNFYLDAHLSFTKTKQDLSFLYATGNVDTLLAIEQPDKSVLVKPVYEIASGEIKSSYSYTGVRLGVAYYFLSTHSSRFNVAATAGVHYLLSSKLEENQNGQWVEIKNENPDRMNYSLQLGAGYNVKISQSWELMINPTLTYFLNDVKWKNVPYSINQRSLGIHFMISKKLGRKS